MDFLELERAEDGADDQDLRTGTFQWTFDNLRNPPTLEVSDRFSGIYVTDKRGYRVA